MFILIIGAIVVIFIIFTCLGDVNDDPFEQRFIENFGRTPEEFIKDKLENGSDIDAIEYLFDINAAKIYHDYGIEMRPFQYYCKKLHIKKNTDSNDNCKIDIVNHIVKTNNINSNEDKTITENKTKQKLVLIDDIQKYEQSFYEEFDYTPVDFITKMQNKGYTKDEIAMYYDIRSASILEKYHLKTVPFNHYYKQVKNTKYSFDNKRLKLIRDCRRQLLPAIQGVSFGKYFYDELNDIFADNDFYYKVNKISLENSGTEFIFDGLNDDYINFKSNVLPDLFFNYDLDQKQSFKIICQKVQNAGYSNKSAVITVYYLIRLLQIFELPYNKRTVEGLSEAIKRIEQ